MQVQKGWILLSLIVGISIAAGCNKSDTVSSASQGPQASATEKQKVLDSQKKNAVEAQIYQINQSKLPPDQKQRMIDQIRASGPR